MAKASIIIPVYNKEDYIKETLISVDKQVDDLEVIIIDDCSLDNGINIIRDFYNSTKKQVKIFKNDTNRGVAYCRNLGMEMAKSDYITFLDADDTLDSNFMEIMLEKAKKYPFVDFIRGNICPFTFEDGVVDGRLEGFYDEQIVIPSMMPNYIYEEVNSSNGRLYRSDFVRNLSFIESNFEDYEFSLNAVLGCKSILYTNKANYNYRIVPSGKNMTVIANYYKTFCDYEDIYDRVLEKYSNVTDDMKDNLRLKQLYLSLCYLNVIANSNISSYDKEAVIEYCLEYFKYKYKLEDDNILVILGRRVSSIYDEKELKRKIKQILSKY